MGSFLGNLIAEAESLEKAVVTEVEKIGPERAPIFAPSESNKERAESVSGALGIIVREFS